MLAAIRQTRDSSESWLWPPNAAHRDYDPYPVQVGAAGVLLVLNQAARAGYPVLSEVDAAARWLTERSSPGRASCLDCCSGAQAPALAAFESGELLDDDGLRESGLALARRLPTSAPTRCSTRWASMTNG